jgi:geranylgeranyl diphosphate synthase type II
LLGKPTGRDVALGRPSAAHEHGLAGAIQHFDHLVARAIDAIPPSRGSGHLRALVRMEAERLVPRAWCEQVRQPAEAQPAHDAAGRAWAQTAAG